VPPAVARFRLHGLRKLNWGQRAGQAYEAHLAALGLDEWLEPGPIALVVGPNAGGKSTLIDLFRALSDPSLWPGLARENYPGDDFSGFDIAGAAFVLSVRFSKWTPEVSETFDKLTILAVAEGPGGARKARVVAPKYELDGTWLAPLHDLLAVCDLPPVHYLAPFGDYPASDLTDKALVGLLNDLSGHFPSVLANPHVAPFKRFQGQGAGAGRIGVLFKDDPGQHAFVHRRALPLGWLQLLSLLAFLRRCEPRSLIVLDEPDRHLHPSLQRVMLDLVAAERRLLDAQVVLATHSSVLTNPELTSRIGAFSFVAARGRCERLTDARRVLDDLGVSSGDLVQANGLIWVEGPSDRIYLKAWLERLAAERGEAAPIERVHYAFVSYGGALLKHLALGGNDPAKVDLRAINRNFAVVIDRDLQPDDDTALTGEKARFLTEAAALGASEQVWITEGYTIESYLPADWPPAVGHIVKSGGRVRVQGIAKVDLADRFATSPPPWTGSFAVGSDLPDRIARLLGQILAWQTPQELIEAPYLPPFFRDAEA
jgi:hypothetical protein